MTTIAGMIEGYQNFRRGYFEDHKDHLQKLAETGQSPKIALVSCCDSRVEPSIIFGCQPGDLFVIRNVANLVPPPESDDSHHGTSAALEFAVTGIGVESIIVLGHAQCGGIKSLMTSQSSENEASYVNKWMSQLHEVQQNILNDPHYETDEAKCSACEFSGIKQSIENLKKFPWIRERVEKNELKLHGWYYNLLRSELYRLDPNLGAFIPLP